MKKIISAILIISLLSSFCIIINAENRQKDGAEYSTVPIDNDLSLDVRSAYLIEASTGKVLYAQNEYDSASPASVTKIMTLLLVCEAIEKGKISLTDKVTVSANAASMGGSQVFLEEGERFSVEELIKCTVIASGNDSAVALAEHTAGSESAFVKLMNARARELGLKSTSFENTTGLDDTTVNHYSCAADIAKMSRELIKHQVILKYSGIWQDSIRNGEFVLTNTNRLVRYYDGCDGLKTGSTDKAGFCVSATAKRGNMRLIAVIMGAETSAARNQAARELLDFGFANYALYERGEEFIEQCKVSKGRLDSIPLYSTPFSCVIDKAKQSLVELEYDIPENLVAPIQKGTVVGSVIYKLDGEQIGKSDIFASLEIEKIQLLDLWGRIIKRMICN